MFLISTPFEKASSHFEQAFGQADQQLSDRPDIKAKVYVM